MEKDLDIIEDQPESKLRRIIVISISIFLILLILSYYFYSGDIFAVLEGKTSSFKVANNEILLKDNIKVIFLGDSYQSLVDIFKSNQKYETSVCLIGNKFEGNYYITSFYTPNITGQTVYSVSGEACNNQTIIDMHTHPIKKCVFSDQDISNLEYFRKINSEAIIGVMCEENRFNFYGYV